MNILVTGGLGYVGGRLAQHLCGLGHTVVLGTRRKTGPPDWLPQAGVVRCQWDSREALRDICDGMDAVIHTAGMNAQACAADPVAALAFNGVATSRLLEAACLQRALRFIYVSTAHVYDSPLTGAITEKTCPKNLHPYAASHRAGEDAVRFSNRRGIIEGVVIRLSNSFGAPAHKSADCWTLLVNDLCRQALTTSKMVLNSSGLQRRDFISMADACNAISHLLHLPAERLGEDMFNVGGRWAPTVWEMACLVRSRCEASMGFKPELSRVMPANCEITAGLDYCIDRLLQTGFRSDADPLAEIDQLLLCSKQWFC